MRRNIIFISKDALNKHALPTYGNGFWKTPNIDQLARKGTVFHRHYTAAGSTAMAFTSMALGKYCYETGRKYYKNEEALNGDTLFDKLYDAGFDCHIVWDDTYTAFAKSHFRCEGVHTVIHSLHQIKQKESAHVKGTIDDMSFDEGETQIALDLIKKEFEDIKNSTDKNVFIWCHLPHVMRGRQGYGSDIDVFDRVIGMARELFADEEIYISADHGHMNGWKDKYHYGYDVGEEAICIPLIAPRIQDRPTVDFPTSTLQMYDILFTHELKEPEYVLCETAYYAQPKRKIAIISGKYKYCYDKEAKREYLYDLDFDKEENHNLAYTEFYDTDRYLWYSTSQCFYYPYWEEAMERLTYFRNIKQSMWRNGTFLEELYNKLLQRAKCYYTKIKLAKPSDHIKNIGK